MKTIWLVILLNTMLLASPGWVDNIQNGRGLLIALIGMTVVFSGLVLLSLIIRVMIHFFEERKKARVPMEESKSEEKNPELSEEEVLAIVTAINLCSIYIEGEKQRLTWVFDQLDQSSWGVTGRAQTLAQRRDISRLKG